MRRTASFASAATPCKAEKRYLQAVKKYLVCSKANRERLMKITGRAVSACLEDEPDIPYAALVSAIDEPKVFAESLLAGIPGGEVEHTRKKRRFQFCAAIVSVAIVMITVFSALAGFYLKYKDATRGDFVVNEIWIAQPDGMTREEFKQYSENIYRDWKNELKDNTK